MAIIEDLYLPYPDFKLQEIIDPEQFDINNEYTVIKMNEVLEILNQLINSSDDGSSGADLVSLTPIIGFVSTKLQSFLEEVVSILQSSTGSSRIGTPALEGLPGLTVAEQLVSIKAQLVGHLHDERYYTKQDTYARGEFDLLKFEKATQSFVATEGQTVFTLTNGTYTTGKNRMEVVVGGVEQTVGVGSGYAVNESSSTSVTLSEGVPAGTKVTLNYYAGEIPVQLGVGHGGSHVEGAYDEIDVTKLKNYNVLSEQLAETAQARGVSIKEFGAIADGLTDNTSFVQQAIDYASINNHSVYIPRNCLYTRASINVKDVMVIDDSGVKRHMSGTQDWDVSLNTELEIIGHRGLVSLYPENTTIAFKNSIIYKQAHSIECDIRHSVDNKLFCFHDTTLDRTTNKTGAIKDLTEVAVRDADIGIKFSPLYVGTKIPYLSESCSVIRGLDFKYFYPQTTVGEITDLTLRKQILTDTINTFKTYGLMNKVVLQTIGLDVAILAREISSEIKIGLQVDNYATYLEVLKWAKLDRNCLLGADNTFWLNNTNLPLNVKKEGIDVFTWTVNTYSTVDRLRKANVYRIMTDVNLTGVK